MPPIIAALYGERLDFPKSYPLDKENDTVVVNAVVFEALDESSPDARFLLHKIWRAWSPG
jgi:hypothetical protein